MYLVTWFLSIFSSCFQGEFLMRIWDNFVLEGELYLFKVGIALVKYYEIELKMCTFNEGLKMLKFTKGTSCVLFFHILEEEIDVKEQYYDEYIEKRKHAIIKTKVQSIPL
jgi:cytohesin/brefeldin A-inhibited guanine nucleotide-exchange protein